MDVEDLVNAIVGVAAVVGTIAIIIYILEIVAFWKIFEKAGSDNWRAVVPILNVLTICQISGVSPWWAVGFFVSVIINVVANAFGGMGLGFIGFLSFVAALCYFGIFTYLMIRLAKAFGKGGGFATGLVLLNVVFVMILAFGKSQYVGAPVANATTGGAPVSNPAPMVAPVASVPQASASNPVSTMSPAPATMPNPAPAPNATPTATAPMNPTSVANTVPTTTPAPAPGMNPTPASNQIPGLSSTPTPVQPISDPNQPMTGFTPTPGSQQ